MQNGQVFRRAGFVVGAVDLGWCAVAEGLVDAPVVERVDALDLEFSVEVLGEGVVVAVAAASG